MTDYRRSEATLGNERAPNYYCARYTTNGHDITQRCNPTPGANSGVTRAMFTEMVDYLKKGHWIDRQTRMVLITMQLRSNNFGLRFLSRFMFEITNMGAVPSNSPFLSDAELEWHSDLSYRCVPGELSCLHAKVLPPSPSFTLFADTAF